MRADGRSCAAMTAACSPFRPPRRSGSLRAGRTSRLFARLPQRDDVVLAHDGHLYPSLLVVGRARVRGREVVIRSDHAAHLVQRLRPSLAGVDLVLDGVAADSFVIGRQTARPQDSSASRPASVMRALVQGGSHTTLTRTSRTPASRSNLSRTSSRMKSDAGQPIAVKVRSTSTTPSLSVIP